MLTLTINERDITMSNHQTFRKGTVGAKCKIVFTDFWLKYNKTIVFKPTSKFIGGPFVVYATDMEIEVTIPWEVMSEVGSFRIGVYGTADDEVLPTLWSEYNEVEDATDTSGEAPQDPSPSVYQQILELTTEAVNISNSVREDANAGKFKGDKGDPGKDAITDQIYNPESENAQSGKAVAEAVSGYVPKKIANSGAPFSSLVATNNVGIGEHNLPTDDSYICIDTIGAELGKNMDNYLYIFAGSIPRRDSNGNLFTGTPIDDEDCVNKKYFDEKIPDNIKNSIGSSSLQQVQDTGYTGIAIKTKNPNAYALDSTLTDNEPIGATGAFASSFGGTSSAQGKRSFAEGTNTIAKGKYSHAEGDNTVALGNESHVEGYATTAYGVGSHAEGDGTIAYGQASHAGGTQSKALGSVSFVHGTGAIAEGLYSTAFGNQTRAGYNNQFIVGKFNNNKLDTFFEVGNGADDSNRSNAFEVYTDGHAEISAMGSTDKSVTTKKYVDDKVAAIPGGGGETWEVISDTTTEFDTPVSQIVINQDTNGNSFSLKKMRVFIDFTVSEAYTGGFARALTASSGLMYIVSQSFSAGTVYGYFIDSEVLPMVNNRCQIISHFNENRMSENGNNFNFEYNSGAVDYAIRTEKMTVTLLGYNVSSISNFDFRLGSAGKINKARILIFGVRA